MPTPRRRLKPPYFEYAALILLFIVSVGLRMRVSVDQINHNLHGNEEARPPVDMADPKTTIITVQPEAAAAGIVAGDVLVAVNGKPYDGVSDLYGPVHRAKPGDDISLRMQRGPEVKVQLASAAPDAPTSRDWAVTIV